MTSTYGFLALMAFCIAAIYIAGTLIDGGWWR